MKLTGSYLLVYALEQIGVKYTFGVPGVHNTEIYDALNTSNQITPMLVTHEGGGAFMADGISRTTDQIGTLVIVPAAGMTQIMSGVGEAYLDGIPMLIISGGTRRDSGRHYQLHQLDQGKVLDGLIKKYYLIEKHEDIVSTIYNAYETATSGEPGPVFVEIPVEIQMFNGNVSNLPPYEPQNTKVQIQSELIKEAADLLIRAQNPGIYVGWGAVDAAAVTARLADILVAPVATTMQGISSFSAKHPFHTGVGFGSASVPAGKKAFAKCDCLITVGARFAELATGSYSLPVPETLIHVDINPEVFDKNYPTTVSIEGDACDILTELVKELESLNYTSPRNKDELANLISMEKASYISGWQKDKKDDIVSPGHFFKSLREKLSDDAIIVVDDGKHTFLTAELFPVYHPRHAISPTDFNCMGYCVPAAIGAKLGNPQKPVAAIVGDGAMLMTGVELLTASTYDIGLMVFVFHDGELGQISQFQSIPLNRKTCSVIGNVNFEGMAIATGAHFLRMDNDSQIDSVISEAIQVSETGRPVLVDVKIDYSKKTMLTKGVVLTNLGRFPTMEKVRFIGRAIKRHITG